MNPSRVAEVEAAKILQLWLGARGRVSLGAEHEADFSITYFDGRSGLGEVKADIDERQQSQRSAMDALSIPCVIPLQAGMGSWYASLLPHASIKQLETAIRPLVAAMIEERMRTYDIRYSWEPRPVGERLRRLGLEHLSFVEAARADCCMLFSQAIAGVIPDDADCCLPWLEECFTDPRFMTSWARLEGARDDERHAFIWIDSGSPGDVQRRAWFHPETPPTRGPRIPGWLTHLWVASSSSFVQRSWAWLFRRGFGWGALRFDE